MMGLVRRYVIGGDTGARELALLVAALLAALTVYASNREAAGIDMDKTFSLLTVMWPTVAAYLFGTFGLQKAKQAGMLTPKKEGG